MPKEKSEQAKARSLTIPQTEAASDTPAKMGGQAAVKTVKQTGESELYTPKAREKKPSKLTAEQFLANAGLEKGIAALVRSMYSNTILSLGEWENTVSALLKRRVR